MGTPAFLFNKQAVAPLATGPAMSGSNANNVVIPVEDIYLSPSLTGGAVDVVFDYGAPVTANAVGIAGDNLDGMSFGISASDDNFASSDVTISAIKVSAGRWGAHFRSFEEGSYRYWKVRLAGLANNCKITNIVVDQRTDLPYLEKDPDIDGFILQSSHLYSQSGIFCGTSITSRRREIVLDFGQVTDTEFTALQGWAEYCLWSAIPFFFVPDIDDEKAAFGVAKEGTKFAAPANKGLHDVAPITLIARVA